MVIGSFLTGLPCGHGPLSLCRPIGCMLSLNKGHVHPILVLLKCGLFGGSPRGVLVGTVTLRACRGCALLRSSLVSGTSLHHNRRAMRGG